MSVNPDIAAHKERCRIIGMADHWIPTRGDLQFIEHDGKRILQQYQYSQEESRFAFYDVPMVTE